MYRVIAIDIDGSGTEFRMHEEAYDALRRYLDEARARLRDDPDRDEVIGDIEGSIASRLADRRTDDRVLAIGDIEAVLGEVGPVAVGSAPKASAAGPATTATAARKRRKLYRIKEGQDIAGVCVGLAAYTEIDLGMVRTIVFFAILLTAGLGLIVYLALAFLLPVVPTYEAWLAELEDLPAAA